MEIRIAIFLFFVFVTVATNTLLIWLVYKVFAGITMTVTETLSEFGRSNETKQGIEAIEIAARKARAITEVTKQKIVEYEPGLIRAQESFKRALASVDSRLQDTVQGIDDGSRKLRDVVAKPAFSVMAFAAGLTKILDKEPK